MKIRTKKDLCVIGGYLTEITPLGVFLAINWNDYAPTTTESVKLSFGVALVSLFALVMALNKMKAPKICVVFGVLFGISFLINSIMQDFMWISGLAFAGTLGQETIFTPLVNKYEQALNYKNEQIAKEMVEQEESKRVSKRSIV